MTKKVDFSVAPIDAQFYSARHFRKHEGCREWWWNDDSEWALGMYEPLEDHKRYNDFELHPDLDDSNCNTYNPDETPYDDESDEKWDSGELGQSDANVVVVPDHIAELAARTLKECVERNKEPEATPTSEWTATHYDNYYHLTKADITAGKIKVDAYFVNKMWRLNEKDDTGALFHSLKTIARFGDKNPIERELKALYAQTKRMAELYGVDLEC